MGAAKDKLTFEKNVSDGWCVLVPAGTWHNITNIGGDANAGLCDLRARPPHAGKVQATAAVAEAGQR